MWLGTREALAPAADAAALFGRAGINDLALVAYVRFASVYRQFKDIDTFMKELNKLLEGK
mgnify:CR=1 FL=1